MVPRLLVFERLYIPPLSHAPLSLPLSKCQVQDIPIAAHFDFTSFVFARDLRRTFFMRCLRPNFPSSCI
jgi:hypothetical protein